MTPRPLARFSGRTAWARSLQTPLREFLRTETGGAAVLLAAAVAALVWVNVDASSYDSLWSTMLSIDVGGAGVALDLRDWVNSGLMTFFFFVVGLEARREFDLGELRERRRFALPLLAALGGHGGRGRDLPRVQRGHAVGARVGDRDVDRHRVRARPARARRAALPRSAARVHADRRRRRRHRRARRDRDRLLRARSAVAPLVVAGRALRRRPRAARRSAAHRPRLPRARSRRVGRSAEGGRRAGRDRARDGRRCRSRTRRRARASSVRPSGSASSASSRPPSSRASAGAELRAATSPNERLQQLLPPVDELRDRAALRARERGHRDRRRTSSRRALDSPITLGIFVGYVVGKPVGIVGSSWLVTRLSGGRLAAARRLGGRRGRGHDRGHRVHGRAAGRDARVRRHTARGGEARDPRAPRSARRLVTWLLFRATARLPRRLRARALLGTAEPLDRPLHRRRSRTRPHPRARSTRRSRSSSTATSNARTADRRSPSSASCSATSATCATSGATCR